MDLSIIVPHYESVRWLKRLLDSIPQADNIEVIVVDDKSKEQINDWHVLKQEYSAGHIMFLENTTGKKGAGVCRNIALSYAKGTWLLFADADDYFLESMPAALEPFFDEQDSDLTDIVFFPPTSINMLTGDKADRHLLYERMIRNYGASAGKRNENLLRYMFNAPWSKLIRREMVEKNHIRFDEVMVSNDVMFSTKCGFYARGIAVSDQIIYCITYSGKSLTSKRDFQASWIRLCVLGDKCEFMRGRMSRHDFYQMPLGCFRYYKAALRYHYSVAEVMQMTKYILKKRIPLVSIGLICNKLDK